jgi:ATP-dependent RNA helicase DeaD
MNQATLQFTDFNLSDALMKALVDLNFETPSPIQEKTIPLMLEGKDIIALAQTGTGKTAAFALPLLQKLSTDVRGTQALIVAPTRELAIQVATAIESMSKYQRGISVAVLCGGQDYSKQLDKLRGGAQVVVGTPGRILDHIERRTLPLGNLTTFILDEADEMLRMGFIEDIETILSKLPEKKQVALFSATMPSRIRHIANNYLKDPASIEIKSDTATVKSVEQRYLFASFPQKSDALVRILAVEDYQGVIVFTRTKSSTEEVAEYLQQQGLRAMAIHGDLTQSLRERIVAQFRQGAIDILVATDVAARGLDVERVTHVINYDVPHDCETYVHRIGRTGRAGRSGVTILFVTPRESRMVNIIEKHTRQRIEKMTIPNDHTIQLAKQHTFMQSILARVEHVNLPSYKRIIDDFMKAHEAIDPKDIAAILALIINKDKPWQCEMPAFKAPVIKEGRSSKNVEFRSDSRPDSRSNTRSQTRNGVERKFGRDRDEVLSPTQSLYRLDVGRVHGVKPGNIVGAIANEAGLESRLITGLKIHEDHSMVRLPKDLSREVMQDLIKAWVCGRQLKLTLVSA